MRDAVDIPVTVKTRLGVDQHYSYEYFSDFVNEVSGSGCIIFVIHARKALLGGVSPKENREVPELRYDWAYQLKAERPDLQIILNGGVTTVEEVKQHLQLLDGVMLGRAAYQSPWVLAECQRELFDSTGVPDREAAVLAMTEYARRQVAQGLPVNKISRHMLGLFQGLAGAKRWRRFISEQAHLDAANDRLLVQALDCMKNSLPSPDLHVA
jgi:tRNA-dihydrouridine synthase A